MEYTVIGDNVNMASRIEASTKAFGADCILSHDMAEKVRHLHRRGCRGGGSKGQTRAAQAVPRSRLLFRDGPARRRETAYSDYAASEAEKVHVV